MIDILSLLLCFDQAVDKTTVKQLSRIALALLTMTGRVTMLGISRWTEKGGSYRTVQRWFNMVLLRAQMSWLFFRTHLYRPGEVCPHFRATVQLCAYLVSKLSFQSNGRLLFDSVSERFHLSFSLYGLRAIVFTQDSWGDVPAHLDCERMDNG